MAAAGFVSRTVESVTTLAQRLRAARECREASLTDAELATNVASKYLTALEAGRYSELPADVYVIGFVRRYARWLELDVSQAVAQLKAERVIAERATVSHGPTEPVVRPRKSRLGNPLWITPERFLGLVVSAFVLVFVGYLWFQVKSFAAAPPLELATQVNNEVVHVDTLTLAGSTDAGATLAINGEVVPVEPSGAFSATVRLIEGVNTIELRAQNRNDKETVKVLQVLATLDGEAGDQTPGAPLPVELPAGQ